jgi:hypothetical protein
MLALLAFQLPVLIALAVLVIVCTIPVNQFVRTVLGAIALAFLFLGFILLLVPK